MPELRSVVYTRSSKFHVLYIYITNTPVCFFILVLKKAVAVAKWEYRGCWRHIIRPNMKTHLSFHCLVVFIIIFHFCRLYFSFKIHKGCVHLSKNPKANEQILFFFFVREPGWCWPTNITETLIMCSPSWIKTGFGNRLHTHLDLF